MCPVASAVAILFKKSASFPPMIASRNPPRMFCAPTTINVVPVTAGRTVPIMLCPVAEQRQQNREAGRCRRHTARQHGL